MSPSRSNGWPAMVTPRVVAALDALCRAVGAEEGRLTWVVRSLEPAHHGARSVLCLRWRDGRAEVDVVSRPVGAGAEPALQVLGRGAEGTGLVDDGLVLGLVCCQPFEGRSAREALGALTRAMVESWRCAPVIGGVAVVTMAGHIEYATAQGRESLEALELATGLDALFGGLGGCGGLPAVIELGVVTLRCEALEGPEPRVLVTLAPAEHLVEAGNVRGARVSEAPGLSARQREVAALAARGLRVADIATALGCAQTTVKTHLRATYAALGVSSRVELARVLGDV